MKKTSRKSAASADRYHHGDLRAALIVAADEILAEHGLEGFSLREAARLAGVSAVAPAHHFGSAAGLLSEVAALGFNELANRLDVKAPKATPTQRLRRQGQGYVRFAATYPGRFQLMFRRDLLSDDHVGLRESGAKAFAQLEQTIRAQRGVQAGKELDPQSRAALLAAWSAVHGFAHLLLDGKLEFLHPGASADEHIERVLPEMLFNLWPD